MFTRLSRGVFGKTGENYSVDKKKKKKMTNELTRMSREAPPNESKQSL